jgi:hypothetical protein
MKGQSYIVEYIIMFGIAFSIFSTISYIFYTQTDFLNKRVGENSAKLINKLSVMNLIKASDCRNCENITITIREIPEKIGGIGYNITFEKRKISTIFFGNIINSTTLNINETYDLFGSTNSNNKKIEIEINNKLKQIRVK